MEESRNEPAVVGLRPWLPWPLSRRRWWTEPVPAERLAALRIGVAAVLLLDVLLTYWPHAGDFFGRDGLAVAEHGRWPLPVGGEDWLTVQVTLGAWTGAAVLLLVGAGTRLAAVAAWGLTLWVVNLNPWVGNAGDRVRGILLFYLMFCSCGAAWSLDRWWSAWRRPDPRPILVHPWLLRLLFLQLVLIYFCNGLYKLGGNDWQSGYALYDVLGDLTVTRWSSAQLPAPFWLTRLLTWLVLGWELSFPLLVAWRWTRPAALAFGVLFHLGIWASLELGGFAPYMLCLYLPLLPWERWKRSPRASLEPLTRN